MIRHSLNLESGLNDGLALPPVLALIAALATRRGLRVVEVHRCRTSGSASPSGSWSASSRRVLLPRGSSLTEGIPPTSARSTRWASRSSPTASTVLPPHGNGLIAVFVCAIVLGIRRPDIRAVLRAALGGHHRDRQARRVRRVRLAADASAGCSTTAGRPWRSSSVTLLVARPVAVVIALAGTRTSRAATAFMAWFGPKGVATMTFSLLVLVRGHRRRRAHLQHRRARRPRLDHRPRADRHARARSGWGAGRRPSEAET